MFFAIILTGCGDDTQKASEKAKSAESSLTTAEQMNNQATDLVSQALDQMSANNASQVTSTLIRAQDLANQIKAELEKSRTAVQEAAAMNITPEYRSYLNAKVRVIDNSIAVNQTDLELISLWLSDPLMQQPDMLQKVTDLQTRETQQEAAAQAADEEANKIAADNPDKIQ